jgi:hypothetical protein
MFVKLVNGIAERYVFNGEKLKKEFPSMSFPKNLTAEVLANFDIYPAVLGTVPDHNPRTQRIYTEETGTLVDGVWTLPYVVVEKTAEEIEAYDDWVVTKALETGTDIPADWAAYRQALRDITAQEGFPNTIDWPESP